VVLSRLDEIRTRAKPPVQFLGATSIGKLAERFAAQTTRARDLPSFVNRMARKLLAYNFSLMSAPS
jgi:hypothetical protein